MPEVLDSIKRIIAERFCASDQKHLVEANTDDRGVIFRTEKEIYAEKGCAYLLYRFDPDELDIFPFFSREGGLRKICDYILFVEQGDTLYVLLIELKEGKTKALPQLTASQYFVEYLIKSGTRIKLSFPANIIYRKIKVKGDTQGKKRQTQMQDPKPDENDVIWYAYDQFRMRYFLAPQ